MPTLSKVFEKYATYQKINDGGTIEGIVVEQDRTCLTASPLYHHLANNSVYIDYRLAGCHTFINHLTGKKLPLKEVRFKRQFPDDASPYIYFFDCQVIFESEMNALVFDSDLTHTKVLNPNQELLPIFEKLAKKTLRKLQNDEKTADKVFQIITKNINGNLPTIDLAAHQLGIGARTLQSRLKKEGTSYRNVG